MWKFLLGVVTGVTLTAVAAVAVVLIVYQSTIRPQIAHASEESRHNSTVSTLQLLRSQIELFKIQHQDTPPAPGALAALLLGKSSSANVSGTDAAGTLGPYVQTFPANPENDKSGVASAPSPNVGWVYTVSDNNFVIQAVNAAGTDVMPY